MRFALKRGAWRGRAAETSLELVLTSARQNDHSADDHRIINLLRYCQPAPLRCGPKSFNVNSSASARRCRKQATHEQAARSSGAHKVAVQRSREHRDGATV